MKRLFAAAALCAVALTPVGAQDVQRCEAADGKVNYVNGPCPPGWRAVRALPPADRPSTADQQAAQQRARQDAAKAAALDRASNAEQARVAKEQERAENKARKQQAHCRRLEARLRQAQEDLASATLKKRPEAQRRVKRADELYVGDCAGTAK